MLPSKIVTDADLYNCILFSTPVNVYFEERLLDSFIQINSFDESIIILDGRFVMRSDVEIFAAL